MCYFWTFFLYSVLIAYKKKMASTTVMLGKNSFPIEVHLHWNENNELDKYIVSLYWAVTTISSVG